MTKIEDITWTVDESDNIATVEDENGVVIASFHGSQAFTHAMHFVSAPSLVAAVKAMDSAASAEEYEEAAADAMTSVFLAEMTRETAEADEDDADASSEPVNLN